MAINDQSLGLRHPVLVLDCKHLLSVLHARYEEGVLVPIFLLVQQPSPILKYSYDTNPEAFAIVKMETCKKTFEASSAAQFPKVVITEAVPVSFRFPTVNEVDAACSDDKWSARTTIEDISSLKPVALDKLTKFDRQRGWYIDVRDRRKGPHKDTFYIHLQSKTKLRSKIEVYYFIETGKRPTHGDTSAIIAQIDTIDRSSNKRTRGKYLVEMREAGHYDEEEKRIYRRPIMPTGSQPTTSKNAKPGNKKRKRDEGVSAQEVGDLEVSNPSSNGRKVHTLYDCQTLV